MLFFLVPVVAAVVIPTPVCLVPGEGGDPAPFAMGRTRTVNGIKLQCGSETVSFLTTQLTTAIEVSIRDLFRNRWRCGSVFELGLSAEE